MLQITFYTCGRCVVSLFFHDVFNTAFPHNGASCCLNEYSLRQARRCHCVCALRGARTYKAHCTKCNSSLTFLLCAIRCYTIHSVYCLPLFFPKTKRSLCTYLCCYARLP